MDPSKRLCVYVYLRAKKVMGSVHGFLYPTRQDAIGFIKRQFPLLSPVEDGLLTFSANGHRIPDEPGYWEVITASLPTGATIEVRLADASLKTEKTGGAEVVPPEFAHDDGINVCMVYKSTAGQVLLDHTHRTKPTNKLSCSFQAFADKMKRARSDLAFFQKGKLLDGDQTCAEAQVDCSKPINVVVKPGGSNSNDPAGTTDRLSPHPRSHAPSSEGAAGAADNCDPPADRPPRPSAPTDDSTASQRPISGSSARQHPLAATSAAPADQGSHAGQGGRVQSSTAADLDKPGTSRAHAAGKKRARGDVNASDGNAERSSPGPGEPPTKKKVEDVQSKWVLSCRLPDDSVLFFRIRPDKPIACIFSAVGDHLGVSWQTDLRFSANGDRLHEGSTVLSSGLVPGDVIDVSTRPCFRPVAIFRREDDRLVVLVFQGVTSDKAAGAEWKLARERGDAVDFEAWRDEVGVPSREKQGVGSLLRVVEWGGMEVFGQ